ncbi:hypothetical protein Tco_0319371 [Tanacetum coccineum]
MHASCQQEAHDTKRLNSSLNERDSANGEGELSKMAANQAIEYAPQCGDLTVESLVFQTNNVVAGIYSSTDRSILFRQIDDSLVHDWNKEVLLGTQYTQDEKFGLLPGILSNSTFSKDPSKVTEIELTSYMIAVNDQKDSMAPLTFSGKKKKVKSQTVTTTLPKPTKGSEQSHSVSSGNIPNPQDPERNKKLAGTRLPSTPLDEGTRKSQPFPEGTTIDPKDSGRNIQSADKGLPSTLLMKSDESDSNSSCSAALKKYDNVLPLTERQLDQHEEVVTSYADLEVSIEGYYDENLDHMDQTDNLVKETMKTIDNISKSGIDERAIPLKDLNRFSETLEVNAALKEEMKKMAESYCTTSGNISGLTKHINNAKLLELLTKLEGF